jgi:hypothetical protein
MFPSLKVLVLAIVVASFYLLKQLTDGITHFLLDCYEVSPKE